MKSGLHLRADDQQRQVVLAGQPLHLIGVLLSDDARFREGYRALDEQCASLAAVGAAIREGVERYAKVLRRYLCRVRQLGDIGSATANTLSLYVSRALWLKRFRVV